MEVFIVILILSLFVLIILSFFLGKALGKRIMFEVMQKIIENERKDAIEKSRSILKGQFSEQLSPFRDDFPIKPSEARFLGAPIDFIGFCGIDDKNVKEIIFIEVKSGNSKLNRTQITIKEAIKNKRIRFIEYRV